MTMDLVKEVERLTALVAKKDILIASLYDDVDRLKTDVKVLEEYVDAYERAACACCALNMP